MVIELVEAVGPIAQIIELEIEAALGREARDRRRLGRYGQPGADFLKLGVEAGNDRRGFVFRTGTFIKGLQTKEEHTLIRARTVEAVAADHGGRNNIGLTLEHLGNLLTRLLG